MNEDDVDVRKGFTELGLKYFDATFIFGIGKQLACLVPRRLRIVSVEFGDWEQCVLLIIYGFES